MAVADSPVIIEVALNGETPKSRNTGVPRSVSEIVADGLRCLDVGAAIVHNHNDDPVLGVTVRHDAQPYIDAWRTILAKRPEAILYPTMGSGGPHTTIEQRYSHVLLLAEAGVLGQGLIDPGSVNLGPRDTGGLPAASEAVYINSYSDARYMFDVCNRLRCGASLSIFEPGFLRVALAYARAGQMPAGAMVKLYFGGGGRRQGLSFGLPPTLPSLDAYLSMLDGTGLAWSVAVLGGDVVDSGMARWALERGGHLRVGLEDYAGPQRPTNVDLVQQAVALCDEVGRPAASCAGARTLLGLASSPSAA
jgi:uncharacterized protein (DUF849 family)